MIGITSTIYWKIILCKSPMIKLKDILNEDEVEDNFGKVAFGGDEKIAKLQGKQTEPDTEFEKEVIRTVMSWLSVSDDESANILHNKFPLLKKAAKIFPQILQPKTSNGTDLFRGIKGHDASWIERLRKTDRDNDWTEYSRISGTLSSMYIYTKPVKYTPHRLVQSWTSNISRALAFGTDEDNPFESVILTTQQNDEFLFNQEFMKKLYGADEEEILHFGKTFKNKVYVIVSEDLFDL